MHELRCRFTPIVPAILAAGCLCTFQTLAGPVFTYTLQSRTLLGSANLTPPGGPSDFESDVAISQAFDDFDVTFDLNASGPPRPVSNASMLVSQQSSTSPTRIEFNTVIDTDAITPPGYATGSNASTAFMAHFIIAEPAQVRIVGVMDGGPMAVEQAFTMGNLLLLNAQVQTVFHRNVLDGELETFNEIVSLAAGKYNLQFECHGGLSNHAQQHPQLLDAASLNVDITVTILINEDLNGDGTVDGADLGLLLGNWGNPGLGDLDGSGAVDGADLGILLSAWT